MRVRSRALAGVGAACLAAVAVAGCGAGSSSSAAASVSVTGHTLTIVLSEPRSIAHDPAELDIVDAEKLAFTADRHEVTDFKLALETARGRQLSDNARKAIVDSTAIAYLGELAPGTSDQTVGITNAVDLLQVSPTDNAIELGSRTPAVPGGPQSLFESWSTYGRTFARVVPGGLEEARAEVAEMKAMGVSSLYVGSDSSAYGRAMAAAVGGDARGAGIKLTRSPASASAIFYGAQSPAAAARFFNHAAAVAPGAKLFGPSSLNVGVFVPSLTAAAAARVYVSIPGYLPAHLPAAARAFAAEFRIAYGHAPNPEAIFGYAAMSALLRVLANEGKNANNRTAVVKEFLSLRRVTSVLGTYSINSAGNTSLDAFVFAHVRAGRLVPFVAAPAG